MSDNTTELTIEVNIDQNYVSKFKPTPDQLVAKSVVSFDNGEIDSPEKISIQATQGFDIQVDNKNTIEITAKAVLVYDNRTGLYEAIFRKNAIQIRGVPIRLTSEFYALSGGMSHRLHSGTFKVATTGNPAGDYLPANLKKRVLCLKP